MDKENKNKFNPEKIVILDFKLIKGQIDAPEAFEESVIVKYDIENTFTLRFNFGEKLAKADFSCTIKTVSQGANKEEAQGRFQFVFVFKIENFEELAKEKEAKILQVEPKLLNSLAAISYSTARGILLTRLQGTPLQKFILPVIDPNKLLLNK